MLFLDADDMFADDGVLAGLDVDLSVAVSTRAGVGYRRCNMASISRQVTPRHFEVFDQFERILAFLGAHPEHDSPEVRDALATSARTFLRSRSDRLRVIPPDLVDEFRRRSAAMTARMSHSSREERN